MLKKLLVNLMGFFAKNLQVVYETGSAVKLANPQNIALPVLAKRQRVLIDKYGVGPHTVREVLYQIGKPTILELSTGRAIIKVLSTQVIPS